jgi:hypothetical protein
MARPVMISKKEVSRMRPRATEFFLLPEDEQAILDTILREIPRAVVIDSRWESVNRPPIRDRIADAGPILGIWNRSARSRQAGSVRTDGRVENPYSDYIVERPRSQSSTAGVLERGRWFTSLTVAGAPEMAAFVGALWRLLNRMTTNRLRRASAVDPHTPERRFRVGPAAYRAARHRQLVLTADALRLTPEDGHDWPHARPYLPFPFVEALTLPGSVSRPMSSSISQTTRSSTPWGRA